MPRPPDRSLAGRTCKARAWYLSDGQMSVHTFDMALLLFAEALGGLLATSNGCAPGTPFPLRGAPL